MARPFASLMTGRALAHPVLGGALTPLVGREADVPSLLADVSSGNKRLITLVGPGGIGKTRLALEAATQAATNFPGGVHVVLLSDVEQPRRLLASVAGAVGARPSADEDLLETLVDKVQGERHLLVLDNLEHLLDAAPLLVPLLLGAPFLTILATSRAPLRLSGEHVVNAGPLPAPDPSHLPSLDALRDYAAVRLFEERARAAAPGFELTARTGPVVTRICQQLDGIPRAIELAAAQCAVLPPAALLPRIEEHLPYPLEGPRNAPENRRTMRATIDWSYNLIPEEEQAAFRAASIFPGSFTAEALAAVAGDLPTDIPPIIARLHGQSLPAPTIGAEASRFRMLRTIRRYALDRARELGELDSLRERHAACYLGLAEDTDHPVISSHADDILARLEVEHPNLLAALETFRDTGQHAPLLRLTVALSGFWVERGHYREGAEWLRRALEADPHGPPPLRARALVALGLLTGFRTDPNAAARHFDEGMAILAGEGDAETIAIARVWQGGVALRAGNLDAAEDAFDQALVAAGNVPDALVAATLTARVMSNLGTVAHERGDLDEAVERLRSALDAYLRNDDALGIARAHRDLGDLLRDRGDSSGSLDHYRESLHPMGESTDPRVVMNALRGAALALAAWDRHELAARLLGAAEVLAEELGPFALVPTDMAAHRRTEAILRTSMTAGDLRRVRQEGRRMLLAEAIAAVLSATTPTGAQEDVPETIRLSSREEEVLWLVAEGLSDREIAARLYLSVRTVEAHVLRIRSRLGARSRTAAVTAAIARGLLDPPTTARD